MSRVDEDEQAIDGFFGTPGAQLWACRRQVEVLARRVDALRACAKATVDMPDSGIEEIAALRRELDFLERGFRECPEARGSRVKGGTPA